MPRLSSNPLKWMSHSQPFVQFLLLVVCLFVSQCLALETRLCNDTRLDHVISSRCKVTCKALKAKSHTYKYQCGDMNAIPNWRGGAYIYSNNLQDILLFPIAARFLKVLNQRSKLPADSDITSEMIIFFLEMLQALPAGCIPWQYAYISSGQTYDFELNVKLFMLLGMLSFSGKLEHSLNLSHFHPRLQAVLDNVQGNKAFTPLLPTILSILNQKFNFALDVGQLGLHDRDTVDYSLLNLIYHEKSSHKSQGISKLFMEMWKTIIYGALTDHMKTTLSFFFQSKYLEELHETVSKFNEKSFVSSIVWRKTYIDRIVRDLYLLTQHWLTNTLIPMQSFPMMSRRNQDTFRQTVVLLESLIAKGYNEQCLTVVIEKFQAFFDGQCKLFVKNFLHDFKDSAYQRKMEIVSEATEIIKLLQLRKSIKELKKPSMRNETKNQNVNFLNVNCTDMKSQNVVSSVSVVDFQDAELNSKDSIEPTSSNMPQSRFNLASRATKRRHTQSDAVDNKKPNIIVPDTNAITDLVDSIVQPANSTIDDLAGIDVNDLIPMDSCDFVLNMHLSLLDNTLQPVLPSISTISEQDESDSLPLLSAFDFNRVLNDPQYLISMLEPSMIHSFPVEPVTELQNSVEQTHQSNNQNDLPVEVNNSTSSTQLHSDLDSAESLLSLLCNNASSIQQSTQNSFKSLFGVSNYQHQLFINSFEDSLRNPEQATLFLIKHDAVFQKHANRMHFYLMKQLQPIERLEMLKTMLEFFNHANQ